jgi:hypothetical protein
VQNAEPLLKAVKVMQLKTLRPVADSASFPEDLMRRFAVGGFAREFERRGLKILFSNGSASSALNWASLSPSDRLVGIEGDEQFLELRLNVGHGFRIARKGSQVPIAEG